nr:MAG TPA: hypothetical protein [Caudoviricetes sp.]
MHNLFIVSNNTIFVKDCSICGNSCAVLRIIRINLIYITFLCGDLFF